MTRNQIEYWKLKEDERSHRENEQHNRSVLAYNYQVLGETQRANIARETENNRSNLAREKEANRNNLAKEVQAHIDSNRNFQLSQQKLEEQHRAARAQEKVLRDQLKQATRNQATLAAVSQQEALTHARAQQEAIRSNLVQEHLKSLAQQETTRSNTAREELSYMQQSEVQRSNLAKEALTRMQNNTNLISVQQTGRHLERSDQLTREQMIVNQMIAAQKAGVDLFNGTLSNLGRVMIPTKGGRN